MHVRVCDEHRNLLSRKRSTYLFLSTIKLFSLLLLREIFKIYNFFFKLVDFILFIAKSQLQYKNVCIIILYDIVVDGR